MSRLFEYFKELLFALFLAFFFLSIIAASIQRVREKELWETPLLPVLAILWGGWVLLFFIWAALLLMGWAPPMKP
jgi:L-asparagine transporter-like permease